MVALTPTHAPRPTIAVLDNFFPHPGSAFRFEEFRSYLDAMPEARVFTTGEGLRFVGEPVDAEALVATHVRAYPEHAGRVAAVSFDDLPSADLYYATFLSIVAAALPAIEARGKPFAFTLYPGGGFAIDQADSDARLRRVTRSPCFRTVITTQTLTTRYLIERGFCRPDQILYLHGGVLSRVLADPPRGKHRYGADKASLDIAFAANRYSADGRDKGYDLFVAAADRIATSIPAARFHVVGNYDPGTIPLGRRANRVTFHGPRPSAFFVEFYRSIDVIVSPTRPFVLAPGMFDGFPTGCTVEAGLQGVAALCTDELALNEAYVDGRDLLIIAPAVEPIVAAIERLAAEPTLIEALGVNFRERALDLYGHDRQMRPRIELLRKLAGDRAIA